MANTSQTRAKPQTHAKPAHSTSSDKTTGDRANAGGSGFGALAGAASAGVAIGVLAMIARKAAVQAPTYLAGEWDQALAAEHKATLKLFDALQATDDTSTTKRSILLMQLKHALAKHALEEENVIYPALREAGEIEGADELNKEHGYVKQYLYELENMPNDSAEYLPTVARFRKDIEEHMQEEEGQLFPALRAKLSEEKNRHLTNMMNKEGFKLA